MSDPALRAALFRFVDVRPACATPADVTRHLHELLDDAGESTKARRASSIAGRKLAAAPSRRSPPPASSRWPSASSSGRAKDSLPTITALWKNGVDATVANTNGTKEQGKTPPPVRGFFFFTAVVGSSGRSMSALPPKRETFRQCIEDVCFVPIADIGLHQHRSVYPSCEECWGLPRSCL